MKTFFLLAILLISLPLGAQTPDFDRYRNTRTEYLVFCEIPDVDYELWFGILGIDRHEKYVVSFCKNGDDWCDEPLREVFLEEVDRAINRETDIQEFRAILGQRVDRFGVKVTYYDSGEGESLANVTFQRAGSYAYFDGFPKRYEACAVRFLD